MPAITFMPFSNPRRERCGLCRQRMALPYLLLLREGDHVAGEMELCARCAMLLQTIFSEHGGLDMIDEEV